MNQILYVQGKKGKEPVGIKKIVRFFSIAIILFGLILLGQGSYGIYKNMSENQKQQTIPQVEIQRQEDSVLISVKHDKAIKQIAYKWNEENETIIDAQNKNEIDKEIELPVGTNTLNVRVVDVNGKENLYQKEYVVEEELKIDLSVIGNNIKIIVTDSKGISKITYKWNNDKEVNISVDDQDNKKIEQIVEIPTGLNTLEINATNIDNVTQTKTQEVRGIKKPEISVVKENEYLIVTVKDEEGLKFINHVLNGGEAQQLECDGQKELKYKQPLVPGDNRVTITAENIHEAKTVFEGLCVYNE